MGIYKRITAILLCVVLLTVPAVYGEDTAQSEAEEDTDRCIMLQSGDRPAYYVRDMNGEPNTDFDTIKLVDNAQNDICTQWKIVPGLAAAEDDEQDYVSFESVNFPGYYLKQSDKEERKVALVELEKAVDQKDFKRKATFLREEGLAPKAGATTYSFSLYGSDPKVYIRHSYFTAYLDPQFNSEGDEDAKLPADATFYVRESGEGYNKVYQLNAAHYGTNYFLRHLGFPLIERGKIQPAYWDGRYDTDWKNGHGQWKIVPGLANNGENYVSFESKIRPGCYLKKEENGDYAEVAALLEAADQEDFKRKATFLREDGLINPNTLTNKEITDLAMPMLPEEWHSYSLYRQSEEETKLYLRHLGNIMRVSPISELTTDANKGNAIFRENADHRVVISKESLADETIESIVIKDADGNVVQPGNRFPAETRLYVTVTPKEGYEVTRIGIGCESYVPDRGYEDIVNGGYLIMPHTDTALTVYTEKFVPTPEVFTHPGVAVNREWLDNMKAHIEAGDKLWVDEFNLLKSLGHASEEPRILWGNKDGVSPFGSGYLDLDDSERMQVVFDATTAYVQALMWYITGKEVYRKNALKIFDCYSQTNSMLVYVKDDRIRVSLAVVKFVVAAEILRYSEFDGAEELKWQDKHTDGFTKYLQLMRPRYDRYWHYMNQHNFCVAATAAAAIFRNDIDSYKQAIQRITTNPERCDKGALCDRNALGVDRCYSHANSGDIISQIREVTVNQLTGDPVEPNLQLIELGRDVGHAYCDVGYFSYLAYTALAQGTKVNNDPTSEQYGQVSDAEDAVGLFEFAGHRILKGANYMVKYTLGYDTLYVPSLVGGDSRNPTIFKQVSDERGGPKNEYWNRFDAVCTGIYNYYRYYDEGKAAVKRGDVTEEDMKYLEQAVIRLHPESLDSDNFIGFGTLLYSGLDSSDSDTITEREYLALQNATVDEAHPDEVFTDDGYLYIGGKYNTYIQFDMSKISEADLGAMTTLGLEVAHGEDGDKVRVDFKLYIGDWNQSTATFNSLNSLTEITDVTAPKYVYIRNSFGSKHLLQDVIYDLKANDEYKNETITIRLQQRQAEAAPNMQKSDCAKVLSLSGTDNSHARPRLVTLDFVNATDAPETPTTGDWSEPGERLFTQKTNFKDFGYMTVDDKRVQDNLFTLTKLNNDGNDVKLRNTEGRQIIYYLGEGDLTDLKKVYYWVGQGYAQDVTLYYTRADDDYLKTERLNFDLHEVENDESFAVAVKRYYTLREKMNAFIDQISGNILAIGKIPGNGWNANNRYELTVSDNVPEGRYKVFMVTTSGDHVYMQFEYAPKWDVSFNVTTKAAQIKVTDGEPLPGSDDELMVYAAVYTKDDEQISDNEQTSGDEQISEIKRLKDAEMKKLDIQQGVGNYSMDFGDLSDFESDDEVRVFLWDAKQKPMRVNQYTVMP